MLQKLKRKREFKAPQFSRNGRIIDPGSTIKKKGQASLKKLRYQLSNLNEIICEG